MSFESLIFYRGLSSQYDTTYPSLHQTRKNRQPRDVASDVHNAADKWFFNRFGVRYRSEAIFVSSDKNIASAYASSPAHVARIIPLGPYSYCWSRALSDLLQVCMHNPSIPDLVTELDSANYIESDLEGAFRLGHEVMLFCDSYICIPVNSTIQQHH